MKTGCPCYKVKNYLDDDSWGFLCGTTGDVADGRVISMAEALKLDPTLHSVAKLPPGWIAFRKAIGDNWSQFRFTGNLAPEPILRAALRVLHVAAFTTRNWTLSEQISRKQINDIWEAIHEIPDLIKRWEGDESLRELRAYLKEYDQRGVPPDSKVFLIRP